MALGETFWNNKIGYRSVVSKKFFSSVIFGIPDDALVRNISSFLKRVISFCETSNRYPTLLIVNNYLLFDV